MLCVEWLTHIYLLYYARNAIASKNPCWKPTILTTFGLNRFRITVKSISWSMSRALDLVWFWRKIKPSSHSLWVSQIFFTRASRRAHLFDNKFIHSALNMYVWYAHACNVHWTECWLPVLCFVLLIALANPKQRERDEGRRIMLTYRISSCARFRLDAHPIVPIIHKDANCVQSHLVYLHTGNWVTKSLKAFGHYSSKFVIRHRLCPLPVRAVYGSLLCCEFFSTSVE